MHVDDYPLAGQRNSGACCGVAATTNKWTLASEHHHTLVTKLVRSRNLNDNNSNYCTWYSQSWQWFVPECKEIKRPLSGWFQRPRTPAQGPSRAWMLSRQGNLWNTTSDAWKFQQHHNNADIKRCGTSKVPELKGMPARYLCTLVAAIALQISIIVLDSAFG